MPEQLPAAAADDNSSSAAEVDFVSQLVSEAAILTAPPVTPVVPAVPQQQPFQLPAGTSIVATSLQQQQPEQAVKDEPPQLQIDPMAAWSVPKAEVPATDAAVKSEITATPVVVPAVASMPQQAPLVQTAPMDPPLPTAPVQQPSPVTAASTGNGKTCENELFFPPSFIKSHDK